MQERQLRFSLGIYLIEKKDKLEFKIYSDNKGVPDEILITMVKNWLKVMEDTYHEKFPSRFLL